MVFVVHGRWDNKYLGSKPQFEKYFSRYADAERFFLKKVDAGAGTIFFEEYSDSGEQLACFNKGHKLVGV